MDIVTAVRLDFAEDHVTGYDLGLARGERPYEAGIAGVNEGFQRPAGTPKLDGFASVKELFHQVVPFFGEEPPQFFVVGVRPVGIEFDGVFAAARNDIVLHAAEDGSVS